MFTRRLRLALLVKDDLGGDTELHFEVFTALSCLVNNDPQQTASVAFDVDDLQAYLLHLPACSLDKYAYEVWLWLTHQAGKVVVTKVACESGPQYAEFQPIH